MLVGVRFVVRRCFSAPQRPICFSLSSHSQLLLESAAAAFPRPAARSTPFDPAAVLSICPFAPSYDSLCGCGCSQRQGRRRRARAASWRALFESAEPDGKEDLSKVETVLISTI